MKRIFGFIAMMLLALALCVAPILAADFDTGTAGTDEYTVTQAEHRAIVCVRTGDQGATLQAQSADGLSWEPLMDVTGATTAATEKSDSLTTQGSDGKELMLVKSDTLSTDEIIAAAKARSDVLFAEPDYVTTYKGENTQTADTSQIVDTSTADYSRFQWGLKNTGLVNKGKIGLDVGNTTGLTGSRSTVIAVMDTGIDTSHPDLQDQMVNLDQYPALEAATGCGKYGYCAVEGESKTDIFPYDIGDTHGTHCAGIIAAAANGFGTKGVAPNVSLMALRVFDKNGEGEYTSAVIKGYDWLIKAREAGVNVRAVNCSFSVPYLPESRELAIQRLGNADIIAIVSAGNENNNVDTNIASSENTIDTSNRIIVDAMDAQGSRSVFSNYGIRTDVFAPGSDILSTLGTLSARFNAFTAALNPSRILAYNSFEENGGTADTEKDVNPLSYHYWSDTATDNCGDAAATGTARSFLGSRALQIDRQDSNTVTLVTAPTALSPASGKKVYLNAAGHGDTGISLIKVSFRKPDGSYTEESSRTYDLICATNQWGADTYLEVPTDGSVDFAHFQMKLRIIFNSTKAKQASIDSIGLGYGLERYGMMSGTSMAAPMVSGVFGLLASEYPSESGEQIAARIKGGTTDPGGLADLCLSGGTVNVAKASTDPDPVVGKIAVDGQKAVLSGYFFGDAAGSVTVGGKAATVTSWSATSITATIPSGLTGEQEFAVKDSTGASGRNYADVGNVANAYTDLAIPSGGTYDETVTAETAALGKAVYLLNAHDDYGFTVTSRELWRYDTVKGTWEDLGTTITAAGRSVDLKDVLSMATCGGKLCLLTADALYQYDGSAWTKTALKLNAALHTEGTLADVKGELMYIGGKAQEASSTNGSKDIMAIDRATGAVTTAGQLPLGLMHIKVAVSGDTVLLLGGAYYLGNDIDYYYHNYVCKTTDMKNYTICDNLPGDDNGQRISFAVAPTKTGLVMTGMVHQDGTTWQDTWNLDAATGKWTASDAVLSTAKTTYPAGCQVGNKFYVWGVSAITNKQTFFRSTDIEGPASAPSVNYEVHGRNYGWDQGWKTDGETAGTTGQALRLEALKVKIEGEDGLSISYQVHVQNTGWMDWKSDGEMAGTTGQSLRMEAVRIKLTGDNASQYSISYRVHVQNKGWTDWVSDGAEAGTTGLGLRAEAIEIKLTAK